jgi:hypothetical protein
MAVRSRLEIAGTSAEPSGVRPPRSAGSIGAPETRQLAQLDADAARPEHVLQQVPRRGDLEQLQDLDDPPAQAGARAHGIGIG